MFCMLVGHLRISDLGLAVEVDVHASLKGRVGTAGYMGALFTLCFLFVMPLFIYQVPS